MSQRYRSMSRLLLALLALAVLAAPASAAPPAACADDSAYPGGVHPGGEWPSYGHDLSNTRSQPLEETISPANAGTLAEAWRFETNGEGDFTGTPIVAGGCLYAGSNRGTVYALNADTGKQVWSAKVPRGGQVNGTVHVAGGLVYAAVAAPPPTAGCSGEACDLGPYVVALDQATGELRWATKSLDEQRGADMYGSPVVFDASDDGIDNPVLFIGVSGWGAEADVSGELRYLFDGGYVLLDARDGRLLQKRFTIADDDTDAHAGCGIWSTPAVDFDEGVLYVGTSNPFKPESEHRYCNAVLKIVADRSAEDFGAIAGHYKATNEDYLSHYTGPYPCQSTGVPSPHPSQEIGTCTDQDLSVGASPNLMPGIGGRKLVGVGQKSGIYHAFEAGSMERAWTQTLGVPTIIGGIVGSTAFDGESIFGPNTVPALLWSVDAAGGAIRFVNAHGPVAYGNQTAVANGVVYISDQKGYLNAFDSATGQQVLARKLVDLTPETFQATQGGTTIARNTVYTSVGTTAMPNGAIVALRPQAGTGAFDVPGPGGGSAPAPPAAGATLLAGPQATTTGYATPRMVLAQGQRLSFANLDVTPHNVVSAEAGLFRSTLVGLAGTGVVEGTERLAGGDYGFYCSVHPGMTGTLTVAGAGR